MNNATIGTYSLTAAILLSATVLLVSLATVRFASETMRRTARRGIYLLAGVLTIASAALMNATVNSDFTLSYVVRYTEQALPLGYKIAGFWAGQEGSLLLWAWMLAVMAAIFAIVTRKQNSDVNSVALGVQAAVILFFCVLMLFAVDEGRASANPFALMPNVVLDGQGMNPMLQDPLMISHPPILFVGYAGFTVPFALMLGALLVGRADSAWAAAARPWVMVSWLFLGVGIILGAMWAYVELGWGGYWAWDPVENASLLPWLTSTALLHSIVVQRKRGMFKRWTAILAALTLILCFFGTYITRSGVISSVHSFGKSVVGTYFLVFLAILVVGSLVAILARWRMLAPENEMESLLSREGAFLGANIALLGMTVVTAVGTMFPVISRAVADQPVTVTQGFYNRMVLPMGLALIALMAFAPVLSYGKVAIDKFARGLVLPVIMAIHGAVAVWVMGYRSAWALAVGAAVNAVIACVAIDLVKAVWARSKQANENLLVAALRLLDLHKSRYGGYLVHVGMVIIAAGLAGSSLYNTKKDIVLMPGQSAQVGKYTLKLDDIRPAKGPNFDSYEVVVFLTDPKGKTHEIHPQYRIYTKTDQRTSEVGLRSNWSEDVYVTLAQLESGGLTTLQVIINPLVRWIWAGGIVLTLGSIYCLLPRFSRRSEEAEEKAAAVRAAKASASRRTARQVA